MSASAVRRRTLTPAFAALAAGIAVNAALVAALAHLSRAAVVFEPEPTVLAAPLRLIDPLQELEQPLASARAIRAEQVMPVPPPPIDAPTFGDDPVPALIAPSAMAAEVPVVPTAIPDFVSADRGLAGPASSAELPAQIALGPGDAPPELLTPINLERFYPRSALRRGIAGVTRLRLGVGDDGAVKTCEIIASTPAGEFDDAARRLGMSLRFRPERRDGRPVASVMMHAIQWQPPERR